MTAKFAIFLFLMFVAFSTEFKFDEETLLQRVEKIYRKKTYELKQRSQESQQRDGVTVLGTEERLKLQEEHPEKEKKSFYLPNPYFKREEPKKKLKMPSIIFNLFPNESSIEVFRDLGTDEIYWKDPNELIPYKIQEKIESCLQKNGEEMSNCLFDFIFDWFEEIPVEASPFIKKLLVPMSQNVDINKRYKLDETPIMLATIFDAEKAIVILIERGANVEAVDVYDHTAMHVAAYFGSELSFKVLFQNGAHVNIKDKHGWTPLMWAELKERDELINLLLESGADAKIKDNDGSILEMVMTRKTTRKSSDRLKGKLKIF